MPTIVTGPPFAVRLRFPPLAVKLLFEPSKIPVPVVLVMVTLIDPALVTKLLVPMICAVAKPEGPTVPAMMVVPVMLIEFEL